MGGTGAAPTPAHGRQRGAGHHFGVGLARAVGGAMIFALPILMTMEM